MGDEKFNLFHILLRNLLYLTDRVTAEPPQRQSADMFGQLYTDSIEGTISRDMTDHATHIHKHIADHQPDNSE